MGDKFEWTGGSQIGFVNIRWPLSKLTVTEGLITLDTGVMGEYSFRPHDVISVRVSRFLFFRRGIRIFHTNFMYNRKIMFFNLDADLILEDIGKAGFAVGG